MKGVVSLLFFAVGGLAMNVYRADGAPTVTRVAVRPNVTPAYEDYWGSDEEEEEVQSQIKKFKLPSLLNVPKHRDHCDDDSQPPEMERGFRGLLG